MLSKQFISEAYPAESEYCRKSAQVTGVIPFNGGPLQVAASFGIATAQAEGSFARMDQLHQAADKALYAAKAAGRNRIHNSAPLTAEVRRTA